MAERTFTSFPVPEALFEVIRSYPHGTVLHARAERYEGFSADGGLSIKTMTGGQAVYTLGRARLLVDERAFTVLNAGQPYQVDVDPGTDSFCLFFRPEAVDGLWQAVTAPLHQLLDQVPPRPYGGFVQRRYRHGTPLSTYLMRWRALNRHQALTMDAGNDALLAALAGLMAQHAQIHKEADHLEAARPSTRAELYRRLHRARDHLEATLHEPQHLAQTAEIAHLSPFHFHRAFRRLFGQTPAEHARHLRLERASTLLRTTDLSFLEICTSLGLDSPGSFGLLFRRHHGVSPGAYRRQHRGDTGQDCASAIPVTPQD